MILRFEDKVYIRQFLNFRNPTLKDMIHEDGNYIDCGICRLTLNEKVS